MDKAVKIHLLDNTAVALGELKKGETVLGVTLNEDIATGHKFALSDILAGETVIKYGNPIGKATEKILKGSHIHTHNTKTTLSDRNGYVYDKLKPVAEEKPLERKVMVYERSGGEIGVRNELWIIPTVGCVNSQARKIAEVFNNRFKPSGIDGVFAYTHPYGCSQLGDDHERTKNTLASIVKHPNAGGVLVLGLGCENNTAESFKEALGNYDKDRIKFLVAQDSKDEIEEGVKILENLYSAVQKDNRVERSISCLKIGLKCGGSDGLSGITANPLLGRFSDYLIAAGGSTVLTEVPEMFGAEHLLMNRARNTEIFEKTVKLINNFKDYYEKNGLPVYENPSPGNKKGGITTLEDKSLGCTQKSGSSEVADVLSGSEPIKQKGLNLLDGPGNDMVAVTSLGAAGCHIVLFTTGRGTPLGGFVPTIKVSSNDALAEKKPGWIDFNAGRVLKEGFEPALNDFITLVLNTASGTRTKNEISDSREIAIFKNGVTL